MPSTTESAKGAAAADGTAPTVMTFAAARRWLDDRVNYERLRHARLGPETFKLDRTRALLAELGDPQKSLKCIHVAGSKGKGSVCEMLAGVLGGCGHAVGVYTSPHLVDVRERVRIGDQMISERLFAQLMSDCRAAAERIEPEHGPATYFELLTALALRFFADKAVDLAVIEVGLGGRLDSTNVIEPIVCALASIQLEHAQILGDSLDKIAREKAGIIKPGVPVISVPQAPEVLEVFRSVAAEVNAPLAVLGEDVEYTWRFEAAHDMGPHARVSVSSPRSEFEHLPVPLPGEHQANNCGLALAVVDRLRALGYEASERGVAAGLGQTRRNGRMEMVLDRPRIMIDGAHNPESVAALMRGLGQVGSFDSIVAVFGCAEDKHIDDMLAELARGADKVIFTRATGNPRAIDPRELQDRYAEHAQKMVQVVEPLKDAINAAARAIGPSDLILVTGSFYLAGEAKALVQAMLARKRREAAREQQGARK